MPHTDHPIEGLVLAARVKQRARELGFDLVGIARAEPSRHADYVRRWLSAGAGGEMTYLSRRADERIDPNIYMPGVLSAVCVAMNYHVPLEPVPPADRHLHGKIARYALGGDYHEIIKARLHALADSIRELAPQAITKACVDTAPVLEREVAARSGIGWMGKNTCLINPRIGSWLLLGEVLTTLDLPPDEEASDHCGTCTRCIDACPTAAITAPYQLDARRCISYLTIEHRGDIDPELRPLIGDWLYGCDICQDVCPHNRKAPPSNEAAFAPRFKTGSIEVSHVLNWSDDDYRGNLKGSAIKRVKLPILKRNASIVAENQRPDTKMPCPATGHGI